jgi:DNA-binding NtrC family response regulator
MSGWKEFKETGKLRPDEKLKNLGLLIVDDEEQIVSSLHETFANQFNVYSSSDPLKALEIFKQERPQLIISDQRMAKMTGIEFFEKIKEIDPLTVRILITGYTDINIVIEALNKELCWKYITKPWKLEELREIVIKAGSHHLASIGDQKKFYNHGFI